MLSHLLRAAGHQADVAPNGKRALEQIAASDFDVIVSDVMMPELDGAGLYRELIARHPRYLGRVIFMTAGYDPIETGLLDDASLPVLHKPFSFGDLSREIRAAVAVGAR
jgi:DNA-binding response OmpR family regulator